MTGLISDIIWWPWTVMLANVVCLYLLIHLFRAEGGKSYWSLFRFRRETFKRDMLVLVPALLLFPVTQGLVELAFYFLYAMPRLAKQVNPWAAYAISALFLGIQHLAIPLMLDGRFIAWRGLMFIPFAFLIGLALKLRPTLLPYVAIVHALMDMMTGMMYVTGF